ncbi:hypothetical protein KFE25_009106 [Diacronema lutheri]|uniref:Uncharacterized protein n=1 Tax=Diacronema lutheri TaxID=2081491 RepID=A0A8J5XZ88_DIALT|nr:hypothetical protein KFE25_009106 [Diacronema lutheri]
MLLPPAPGNMLFSPGARRDAGDDDDDDDDDDDAIRAHEMRGAVRGLTAWQTGRHKELDRELADLEAAFANKVRELRSRLADDFIAAKGLMNERLRALEVEQRAQQMPVEKWALGPLLARHEDEITMVHTELAAELRNIQDVHERLIDQLKHLRARDERRLHQRKEAVTNVISTMQTMQAELARTLERADKAERSALGWHSECESLRLKLREADERDTRAAADRVAREMAESSHAREAAGRRAAEEKAAEREAQLRESREQVLALREKMEADRETREVSSFTSPRRTLWGPCSSQPPAPRTADSIQSRRAIFEGPGSEGKGQSRGKENSGSAAVSSKPTFRRFPTLPPSFTQGPNSARKDMPAAAAHASARRGRNSLSPAQPMG